MMLQLFTRSLLSILVANTVFPSSNAAVEVTYYRTGERYASPYGYFDKAEAWCISEGKTLCRQIDLCPDGVGALDELFGNPFCGTPPGDHETIYVSDSCDISGTLGKALINAIS